MHGLAVAVQVLGEKVAELSEENHALKEHIGLLQGELARRQEAEAAQTDQPDLTHTHG